VLMDTVTNTRPTLPGNQMISGCPLCLQIALPNLSDQCLLERAYAGEEHAFEVLVHRYQHTLYQFVRRYVGSGEAHDVVQLTLLQLYISLNTALSP
jgi:hypothetical protein